MGATGKDMDFRKLCGKASSKLRQLLEGFRVKTTVFFLR